MSNLIVIRIIPQKAVDPNTFTGYLKPAGPSGLGPLQVTAFDLSFNSPTTGQNVGTATFIAPSTPPSPTQAVKVPPGPTPTFASPQYAPDPTSGIIQQYDLVPATTGETAFYQLESVATAVIEVSSVAKFENLKIVAQWGSDSNATSIPISSNFYDVATAAGPALHLNAWNPSTTSSALQPDPWAGLAPSLYLQLPKPPSAANPFTFQLPSDGTPPRFDALMKAVQQILQGDPGSAVTATTTAAATAGSSSLQFPSTSAGINAGMSVSGTGIPAGITVVAINPTGLVTLSQEVSAAVPASTVVTFTANRGALSVDQCRNIAYEIVWSQQPPLPTPSDPIEDDYTKSDSQNSGSLLDGTTPNKYESDRQQFEAQLKSYYTVANTTADRLTNFVFSLSAAVACEQQSLAATEILLEFPVNPGSVSTGSVTETEVILTAIDTINPPINFGVPAAYFYALAATIPLQFKAQQRFKMATGSRLTGLLSDLTSAIHAGIITDSEAFVMAGSVRINAAQAARRIVTLGVPSGSPTPLAPLDTVALVTTNDAASGETLSFTSVAAVKTGMSVSGANIPAGTTVKSISGTSVTLSAPLLGDVPAGSSIVFTPSYPTGLQSLVQSWLNFPVSVAGATSSETYQPTDDATKFWPSAATATAQQGAFLNLVLCSLTQGFIIPPPFNVALGDKITGNPLLSTPTTVAALAGVTAQQWTDFFTKNPTWLPTFTQPGNTPARIAAFIRHVKKLFAVGSSSPAGPFVLATSSATAAGAKFLQFPPTTAIAPGMSVSGPPSIPPGTPPSIPPGTTVAGVTPTAAATSVELTQAVVAPGVPANANITFSLTVSASPSSGPSALPGPSTDWLGNCLSAYGAYTLGGGFDVPKLRAAAATVFPSDRAAQDWIVEALVTIDALYQIMKSVTLPSLPASALPGYEFSLIEALYARGFTSAARMTEYSGSDFQQVLAGTVAYDLAGSIYASATAIAPHAPVAPPNGGFQPVNSDGSLINCVPPPCSSPLGPIAYLSEMLKVSEISTCEMPIVAAVSLSTSGDTPSESTTLPFVSSVGLISGMSVNGVNIPTGTTVRSVTLTSVTLSQPVSGDVPSGSIITFAAATLGSVLGQRRGPIGNLAASCANLETPLPLIDIVNECLEYMGSLATPTNGTVYDTSSDALAGHALCHDEPCPDKDEKPACHDPAKIFAALPEYSTPAVPVSANSAVEPAVYNKLRTDFSSCHLPYSQAIDVSRTYLRYFHSCRFEEMRTFRKCITEFVLDPVNEPAGFQSYLWRYPVRIDIAIEYLGITPEEYALLFQGTAAPPCAVPTDNAHSPGAAGSSPGGQDAEVSRGPAVWQLYGFASPGDNESWITTVIKLPEFLNRTCLTYCEFFELWKSGLVQFRSGDDRENGAFPQCEPCCLDRLRLQFRDEEQALQQGLLQLAIFIRLWRKLRDSCCFCYSFAQLRDICDVLHLFNERALNRDFIRQLAAFQMLRDQFCLELADPCEKPSAAAIDADRTHLLALWVGPAAAKWGWAVRQLCEKIVNYAKRRHKCEHRSAEFVELLNGKLDALSRLVGFDPASATDNWHALPTHTLRFAEVLAKLAASKFSIAEVLYLFTADEQPECDGVFPLQEECEALELPLGLPDDECEFSLWRLRRELLNAAELPFSPGTDLRISLSVDETGGDCCESTGERHHEGLHLEAKISEQCADEWDWRRVAAVLQDELGFAQSDILDFGRHFFPHILREAGYQVDSASTRYTSSLPTANTTPAIWIAPDEGPFQYDASAQQLWIRVPLSDYTVIAQLTRLRALNADEQKAVQDLNFQPRAMLALFAVLFPDFPRAEQHLIEEREACERWDYFRRHVAHCHHLCHVIARHLAGHVAAVTRQECPESEAAALLILRELLGDENKATADWEKDDGTEPPVTWTPPPNGGAFVALLGLAGTGLVAEYKLESGGLVWRDVSGSLCGFGPVRGRENAPVPTVLPSLGATIAPPLSSFVSVRNGFLVKKAGGALLGGAQGFDVTWSGALLVDEEGHYEFWAGAPASGNEKPGCKPAERSKWRVALKRGSRSWVLLSHNWPGEEERRSASRQLRRGAYELTVELVQPAPEFVSDDQVHPLHTGLEVKYSGPDTGCERVAIPRRQLFSILKEQTLGDGVSTSSAGATSFLGRYYTSSFRDIRRTYQRAFKALLFAHRLALSARRDCQGESELGYMLAERAKFAGVSYFKTGSGFTSHAADFDFNFLPLADNYHAPTTDSRTHPSQKRIQAMFDWWERLFDYAVARDDVRCRHDRQLWHLFEEARETEPADPAPLLGRFGIDCRYWRLVLHYCQGQNVPVYALGSIDLEDDRWGVRVWHADRWLSALDCRFAAKDMTAARPDLWASDDPSAVVSGETKTGNANLSAFLCNGCLENGEPRRYEELKRVNDCLREHGRDALVAFLCHLDRVPLSWLPGQFAKVPRDLSDLLLLDVEAGLCEKASRIEEAITAVQNFVRRARLRLEPGWTVTRDFARFWDREFATFEIWQACKHRHLYNENGIEWSDLEKARGVEAFRFLESKLRSPELTVAAPGGLEWWPDQRPPGHREPPLLQQQEPSEIRLLPALREGLNLLGTPERGARPAWLAAVQSNGGTGAGNVSGGAGVRQIPFWMEAAISLGTRFYRVAAAGKPPAATRFEPHKRGDLKDCVTCCEECGCSHPDLVDEYYFWLIPGQVYEPPVTPAPSGFTSSGDYQNGYQDDFYDPTQQQSAVWQDPNQLPQLLEWEPTPAVRLAWCRIHNGEFQQPRRSLRALEVSGPSDLQFLGRTVDSLTFSVAKGVPPSGYSDASAPGFRYDLAADNAVVLPQVVAPTSLPTFLSPSDLPAYPYFVFDAPGEPLFPLSPFSPSLAIAGTLRSHCRFEAALAWYRQAFDPLQRDCTWIHCGTDTSRAGARNAPANPVASTTNVPSAVRIPGEGSSGGEACCDSTDISCEQARNRSVVLHYLETLVEWGDALMGRWNSPEAFQQARLIFDTADMILGRIPSTVKLPDPSQSPQVSAFAPAFAPLNPRLLDLYEVVGDRLHEIRSCLNWHRLRNTSRSCEEPYFGNSPVREGWRTNVVPCAEEAECCHLSSLYRFTFLIQKAQEYASKVQDLGNALLAAFEKGDAEFLASLRASHERELLTLGLEIKKDQWRDADWQIEALQKTKAVSQANLNYYNGLIQRALINGEITYQDLTITSTVLRGVADITDAIGGAIGAVGNIFTGVAGFGGTPLFYYQLPFGSPLASEFASEARILISLAEIANSTAGLDLTEAGWQRRSDEWAHQTDILTIEIQQIERQILGAERRRDQALLELDSHRRQMEQSQEVQNFLRDKFTAHDLYLFLQKETAALHYKTYDLALYTARQAQHAFNVERGHTARRFIPECAWDDLHEGLMAGERLSAALRHMEKAYLDENVREYELTKQFSLRLHFPIEFLRLRATGRCEIDIPEWMFDLDFPSHYMRRIKNVTLTIPCVTGPFTGVHCRMTLLSTMTRIDPRLSAPVHECCCPPEPCCGECSEDERLAREYQFCPDDPRIVRQYGAREAIATSTAQNDSGLFELNFNDQRYLPFEFMGAVSCWRIELPPENNYFEMGSLTDTIIRLNYTAREGGERLRRAASAAAQRYLPGDGWRFLDVRHEFPDAWQLFRDCPRGDKWERRLRLRLDRKMFPFVPGAHEIWIDRVAILLSTDEYEDCNCPKSEGCPCPEHGEPACRIIEFAHGDEECDYERKVLCRASDEWPDLYCGIFDTRIGPLGGRGHHAEAEFRFHAATGEVEHVYLFCHYTIRSCAETRRRVSSRGRNDERWDRPAHDQLPGSFLDV